MKKAEISGILLENMHNLPILNHNWNKFALEIWIEDPLHADAVKKMVILHCKDLLEGFLMILKWETGERVVIF